MSAEYELARTPSDEWSDLPLTQITDAAESLGPPEAKQIQQKLKAFYAIYDEDKLEAGIDDIVNWTLRNGMEALNEKLKQKYGKSLEDSILNNESVEEEQEEELFEDTGKDEIEQQAVQKSNGSNNGIDSEELSDEEKQVFAELKRFFAIYDPERTERNYVALLRYVRKKGRPALNEKLYSKYGANLNTFEEKQGDDNESLPSILDDMPPPMPQKHRERHVSLSRRSGINPIDDKEDNMERLQMYDRLSRFYNLYGKARLNRGIGNVVDWALEHGEVKLNKKLRKKYNKDLTDLNDDPVRLSVRERRNQKNQLKEESSPEELKKLPKPRTEDEVEEKAYSKDSGLTRKSGVNPVNSKYDDAARLELSTRLTQFYTYFNKEKLKDGVGVIVEWTIEHGEEGLNAQLQKKYGYDLTTFEQKIKVDEEKEREKRETEELKLQVESKLLNIRERLIKFFKKYDPSRADKSLDILIKYIEQKGFSAMNEKLFAKYGADINTMEQEEEDETDAERLARVRALQRRSQKYTLPAWVNGALEKFYVKYNPIYVENGGVETILEWAQRNGMDALNNALKEQYNESLDEFVGEMEKLRKDLTEFYKKKDENKLNQGIDSILNWGIKNGREALNTQLQRKYGECLDGEKNYSSQNEDQENF